MKNLWRILPPILNFIGGFLFLSSLGLLIGNFINGFQEGYLIFLFILILAMAIGISIFSGFARDKAITTCNHCGGSLKGTEKAHVTVLSAKEESNGQDKVKVEIGITCPHCGEVSFHKEEFTVSDSKELADEVRKHVKRTYDSEPEFKVCD